MMGRSWSRAAFILLMAVPLGGASMAAVGSPALAASVRASAALTRGADLASASTAAQGDNLLGVSAVSTTDAWAVGYKCSNADCSEPNLTYSTLIDHWNGKTWSTVASPDSGPSDQLTGVSAVSATDAWAVGTWDAYGVNAHALFLHWNGKKWSKVPSPSPVGRALFAVSTTSATNAWAVGQYTNSGDRDATLT